MTFVTFVRITLKAIKPFSFKFPLESETIIYSSDNIYLFLLNKNNLIINLIIHLFFFVKFIYIENYIS